MANFFENGLKMIGGATIKKRCFSNNKKVYTTRPDNLILSKIVLCLKAFILISKIHTANFDTSSWNPKFELLISLLTTFKAMKLTSLCVTYFRNLH